jgi:hypothetical protein
LNKRRDLKELSLELPKDKKTELSMPKLLSNSVSKDFWPASAQDLVNQAEPTVIFWKEKSLNFMLKRSNQEKNDCLS